MTTTEAKQAALVERWLRSVHEDPDGEAAVGWRRFVEALTRLVEPVQQFARVQSRHFIPVVQSMYRFTRAGEMWSDDSRLSVVEHWLRAAGHRAGRDALGTLLGEVFGDMPEPGRLRELRRRYRATGSARGSEAPQIFGAYVLSARSAGVLPPSRPFAAVRSSTDTYGEFSDDGCNDGSFYQYMLDHLKAVAEAVADLIAVWRADLLLAIQRWLSPTVYQFADHVPSLACSPCGVIRMASPEVPRGPQLGLQLDAPSPSWALAA